VKYYRLYVDEDASDADLVAALRSRHVDVVTAVDAGLKEATDEAQLRCAATERRVLYTFNAKHFCALHGRLVTDGEFHAGIIIGTQQRYTVGGQLRRLLKLLAAFKPEQMVNRIEFLSRWG